MKWGLKRGILIDAYYVICMYFDAVVVFTASFEYLGTQQLNPFIIGLNEKKSHFWFLIFD